MLRLRDIMTRDVLTLAPDLSLRDALSVLVTKHISGAPVVRQGKVVGVVSLTDLAEFASASSGVPTERPVSPAWDEEESDELTEGAEPASAFFAEMWDDAGADVDERMAESANPEWNALEQATVGEVMSRDVLSMPSDTPVEDAADFMRSATIHRVLVMADGKLEGIVSTSDIAAAVADNRLSHRVYVFPRPQRPVVRRP
jgi:CBS domain-containing protein